MFSNHFHLFDKNKGLPLYFYTHFFQPHIVAVPAGFLQGCQFLTSALMQKPVDVTGCNCEPVRCSDLIPAGSSLNDQDHEEHETSTTIEQSQEYEYMTVLEPIPDDYKFSFVKLIDDEKPPSRPTTPVAPPPTKPAPPLGSTPRRQNRRRMMIITKTRKINFDLPED